MPIQLNNVLVQVWIPDKNLEIKPTRHQYLMLLRVGHFSNSFLMTMQLHNWLLCEIFQQIISNVTLKVLLDVLILLAH